MSEVTPRSHYASVRKAYDRARHYWQQQGDTKRAQLTNEALDELFAYFDGDGVPYLITDPDYQPDVVNPFAQLADWATQYGVKGGQPLEGDLDELLNQNEIASLENYVGLVHEHKTA